GVHGARGQQAGEFLKIIRDTRWNTNIDTVPTRVWDDVKEVMQKAGMTSRECQAELGGSHSSAAIYASAPSRERLSRVAAVLDDDDLELMATNDVFWDTVVSVELDGIEEVFDATVLGTHNFVANGVSVHNSI